MERYMRRALQIARNGLPWAMPNPMVGAVITNPDGRIIGEGYHRRCGEAHAEVNAIDSVANPEQLRDSTMYVTLEPCAHYGRTGPCSKLIIEKGIPRVVVGTRDPFEKVDGKGIEMLRDAGIDVTVGVLERECRQLNAIFFTAHTLHRPFIILKWAQSADGYMDISRGAGESPLRISSPLTTTLTHQLRAVCDGILVGSNTILADNPTLDTRLWPGRSPRPIILDRRHRVTSEAKIMHRDPIVIDSHEPMIDIMHRLYDDGITSILVEGGASVLTSLIDEGLWDLARVETGTMAVDEKGCTEAPTISGMESVKETRFGEQIVKYYSKNTLIDVKNL